MESYTIREGFSEIIIFLGKNYPTRLSALQAAARLMGAEVQREHFNTRRDTYRDDHNDGYIVPECNEPDGQ